MDSMAKVSHASFFTLMSVLRSNLCFRELILPQAQSPYSLDDIIDELEIPLLFVAPLEKLLADPSLLAR